VRTRGGRLGPEALALLEDLKAGKSVTLTDGVRPRPQVFDTLDGSGLAEPRGVSMQILNALLDRGLAEIVTRRRRMAGLHVPVVIRFVGLTDAGRVFEQPSPAAAESAARVGGRAQRAHGGKFAASESRKLTPAVKRAAAELGRRGGSRTSQAKRRANRENGKKGAGVPRPSRRKAEP